MIWAAFFDHQHHLRGYVRFGALPVTSPDHYRCLPEGTLSFEGAVEVSRELSRGAVNGLVHGLRWYRQAKAPNGEAGHN